MKPVKSILFLSVVVVSIIVFWLSPGINRAKDTTYIRYYEDTDKKLVSNTPGDSLHKRDQRKSYKAERIHSRDRFSKIKGKQFSRGMQFEDSLYVINHFTASKNLLCLTLRQPTPESLKLFFVFILLIS